MDEAARLVAIDAIKRVKARFFLAVDDKDWATYATLFTDDARFDVSDAFAEPGVGEAVSGLEGAAEAIGGGAMARLAASALEGIDTAHIGYMPVIGVDGAAAEAVWPVEDWLWFADPTRPALHGFGRYHERYVREGNGWRISRMRYTRLRFVDRETASR